jgi:RNA polymerase sigma-70 factor, ECF subfamily
VTGPNVYSCDWEDDTPSTLLREVKAQSPVAWNRLVSLYSRLVYRWCRKAGLQPADAADVGQEVFRAVARKIAVYRHDRNGDTFRGWLRKITRSKICDWARKKPPVYTGFPWIGRLRRQCQLPAWDLPEPDERSDAEDRSVVYRAACELMRAEFEERTWLAFWQTTVEEIPVEDVAARLCMSTNAVRLAKSRVLRRLREEFADFIDKDGS